MDEVEATTSIEGVPAITIPNLLDWFDSKVEIQQKAKSGADPMAVHFLDEKISLLEVLKEELLEMVLEDMDANTD